jgi:hypothetical protein
MPAGGPLGRAITNSQGAFVTPIVTNNPVFQVKLATVDDRMEQKSGNSEKMQDKIKRGDTISGTPIGERPNTKQKKRMGVVQNILKDANGNETAYVITDEDGDQLKIDPSSASFIDMHDTGREASSGERWEMTENVSCRAMLFEEWKQSK